MGYTLTNSAVDSRLGELELLRGEETSVTRTLLTMIRGQQLQDNDLLLRATLRFVEARNSTDEDVLAAARSLEVLADFDVLIMRVVYEDEYDDAESCFEESADIDTYLRGHQNLFHRSWCIRDLGDSARTGAHLQTFSQNINPTWYTSVSTRPIMADDNVASSLAVPNLAASTNTGPAKQPLAEIGTKDSPESAPKRRKLRIVFKKSKDKEVSVIKPVEDSDQTESELESDSAHEPMVTPETQSKRQPKMRAEQDRLPEAEDIPIPEGIDLARFSRGYRSTPPNRPVRFPGQMIIDDGSYDREPPAAGELDPSKMIISFNVEKKDKLTGLLVPAGNATYKYRGDVVWDDKTSVSALQHWRTQNFARALGPSQPPREMWVESERDLLLSIVQQHLADVGGRWLKISWETVAAAYNYQIHGTTQTAGELGAERMYTFSNTPKGKMLTNVSKGQRLAQNRTAPTRTALSCQNQLQVFTHKDVLQVINAAKGTEKKPDMKKNKEGDYEQEDEQKYDIDYHHHNGAGVMEYFAMDTLLDQDGNLAQRASYPDADAPDPQLGNNFGVGPPHASATDSHESSAKRRAAFEAAEERRITGPRAIAKDKAGKKWLRGG
ncbi:uncharacterized protein RCO7_08391 [Rhynchosporium graminicola]|uniref:Uncharacterized protein n=1 Tax=Rhynchosporium graminicola TaxID=2792576 RepID=A0A1E1KQ81_9HELO|nr:uncharacterized protein RCO7_08391 [Rhynchosporium commune]